MHNMNLLWINHTTWLPKHISLSSKEVKDRVCSGYRLPRPTMKVRMPMSAQEAYEPSPQEGVYTTGRCPLDLYTQMLQCWHVDPELRPTFAGMNTYLMNYYSKFNRTPNSKC
ncbi:hypothetical protein D915_001278 [Fasciola hepatica]|uniref:Serine-threonine/tyrosine-protein kinase catalytic domain-containing protein n=1 Tax=Fasciola hepatica TaxID=6192 RepID=A0A4E0RKQ8_FASHE|nr:hypothetical protein D915_001278 [Fasciola hepatica]